MPTDYKARDLEEFSNCLRPGKPSIRYISMLKCMVKGLNGPTNDFSNWLAASLGKRLAVNIARIDPYTQTGEGTRVNILDILEEGL